MSDRDRAPAARPSNPSSPSLRPLRSVALSAVSLVESAWRARRTPVAVPIVGAGAAPVLEVGRPFAVLVWNLQFCGGRSRKFFYDGGDAVFVPPELREPALDRVAQVIGDHRVDVVLLQEVDRGSDRTGRMDQQAEILARTPFPCHASAPYHDVRYVPFPPHQHLGRVDVHLSVLSRLRMTRGTRWPLPGLREPWVRRQFNLRRAALELELPLSDGRALSVFDVHLSAFSRGDGTLPRQLGVVADRVGAAIASGRPTVLAGDFNALPPGDDPARLGADADQYAVDRDAMAPLFDRFASAVPLEAHRDEPERWRTWLPFGSAVADRAIDHLFHGPGVEVLDASVSTGVSDASDHLPLRVELVVHPVR